VEKLSVVGEEEQAGGVLVEASDGVEAGVALGEARGQEIVNGLAGIFGAAGVAVGFVKDQDKRRRRIELLAEQADAVVRRQIGVAENRAGVVGDNARADEALNFFAGAIAEVG